MNEAYISFETAKLLKEKGFDWECLGFYKYYKSSPKAKPHLEMNISIYPSARENSVAPCPTQQMACRWLREVHKIDISVTPDDGSWWIKVTELEYWSGVFGGKVLNSDDIKYAYEGDTNTKEECYEAGLWYVLKNLI